MNDKIEKAIKLMYSGLASPATRDFVIISTRSFTDALIILRSIPADPQEPTPSPEPENDKIKILVAKSGNLRNRLEDAARVADKINDIGIALLASTKRQLVSLAERPLLSDQINKALGCVKKLRQLADSLQAVEVADNLRAILRPLSAEPQEPTPSPEAVCKRCGGSKEEPQVSPLNNGYPEPCTACQPAEPKHITPKPETFLTPAKGKCVKCFGHPDWIDACMHCGGTGKEPKAEEKEFRSEFESLMQSAHGIIGTESYTVHLKRELVERVCDHIDRLEADLDEANTQAGDCSNGVCAQLAEAKARIAKLKDRRDEFYNMWVDTTKSAAILIHTNKRLSEELIHLKKALGEKDE